jgi:serine phosphatase RsbU (regulator of sigma subunit)
MQIQAEAVRKALAKYQGRQIRRDDLTILGFIPHGR